MVNTGAFIHTNCLTSRAALSDADRHRDVKYAYMITAHDQQRSIPCNPSAIHMDNTRRGDLEPVSSLCFEA